MKPEVAIPLQRQDSGFRDLIVQELPQEAEHRAIPGKAGNPQAVFFKCAHIDEHFVALSGADNQVVRLDSRRQEAAIRCNDRHRAVFHLQFEKASVASIENAETHQTGWNGLPNRSNGAVDNQRIAQKSVFEAFLGEHVGHLSIVAEGLVLKDDGEVINSIGFGQIS